MNDKRLAVILGAGAAVDAASPSNEINRDFKPPTVLTLFDSKAHNNLNIDYYGVSNLWDDVQLAVSLARKENSSVSIEGFLKGLRESDEEELRREFRHFAPYLKKYFASISNEYCKFPNNYQNLIRKTLVSKFDKVTYITLNYDLLFDKALERTSLTSNHFKISNTNFYKYVSDSWSYYKIHGSIDWVRPFTGAEKAISSNLPDYLRAIDASPEPFENNLGDYQISSDFQTQTQFLYPAVTVPAGDAKFNMPETLEIKMTSEVKKCENFLIIGYSGVDDDVWDLLKESNKIKTLFFVTNTENSANKLVAKSMSIFGNNIRPTSYFQGFQSFVDTNEKFGLKAFINSL